MITLLNQPWTERLGWTLLHSLVAGNSGGSPLGASPGFGRNFGARAATQLPGLRCWR